MPASAPAFRPDLSRADFTLLVVGAVIGADVYIVAAMGAASLGPAQLVAWGFAGALAAVIALAFVQCAAIDSDVGGSYAYAQRAFGPLVGFLTGWALYAGEWIALPVFPLAFVSYLHRLLPGLPDAADIPAKLALVLAITGVNVFGARKGARLNDVLAIAKLLPLGLLIVAAIALTVVHPHIASTHLQPFAPMGWSGFGSAVVPIFWAYAGFELAVLPAAEVRDPRRTLPQGLVMGMAIATGLYLLAAFAVVSGLPWQDAAASSSPLASAMSAISTALGGPGTAAVVVMSVGAVVSIAGVYDAFTLGVSRLSYALAADGMFPSEFARLHPKYRTPHVGLGFQAVCAMVGSTIFDLRGLITIAVFFLGLSYAVTGLAALRLVQRHPAQALHLPALRVLLVLAAAAGLYLATQAPVREITIGVAVMLLGLALYLARGARWRAVAVAVEKDESSAVAWAGHEYRWLMRGTHRLFRRSPPQRDGPAARQRS